MIEELLGGEQFCFTLGALAFWQVWLAMGLYLAIFFGPALILTNLDVEKYPENRHLSLPKLLTLHVVQLMAANLLLLVTAPMLLGFGKSFAFDMLGNYLVMIGSHAPNQIVKQFGFAFLASGALLVVSFWGAVRLKRKLILGGVGMFGLQYSIAYLDFGFVLDERQRILSEGRRSGGALLATVQDVTMMGVIAWAAAMVLFVNLMHYLWVSPVKLRVAAIPFVAVVTSLPVFALAELLGASVDFTILKAVFGGP